MLVTVLLLLLSPSSGWAVWEENDLHEPKTQAIQVNIGQAPVQSVYLMKNYKYARPVFLLSFFVDQNVEKTQMMTETAFYGLSQRLRDLIHQEPVRAVESTCKQPLDVTLKLENSGVQAHQYCLEQLKPEIARDLNLWFQAVKGGL